MGGDTAGWAAVLPRLFAESYVPYAGCRTTYVEGVVPDALVSRLHLVAVTQQGLVVVCRSAQGWRFLPGGTREPGESLEELARRELMEEAGAVLEDGVHLFSAHLALSEREKPYRPHLPHPRAYWAYAVAQVSIVGLPTLPPDGEVIDEVLTLPPLSAVEYLDGQDPVHADVLRHAHGLGLLR